MKRVQRVFGDVDALRFVDGRLDDERRSAFAAHLADDPDEADRVGVWQRQNDVVRAAFASVAAEPVPVWLRLGNMVGEDGPERPPVAADPIRLAPAAPAAAAQRRAMGTRSLSVGAAVLIVVGLGVLAATRSLLPAIGPAAEPTVQSTGELTRAFRARAVDAYRTFALDPVHPVEIASTQQAQLEHWLQRRLSLPIHAPDLRAEGWSLLGGRVAPGDFGPAAFFVYESESNERMGLYIARTGAAPDPVPSIDKVPGGATVAWTAGPVGIVLAVDKDTAWLGRNAPALKAQVSRAIED